MFVTFCFIKFSLNFVKIRYAEMQNASIYLGKKKRTSPNLGFAHAKSENFKCSVLSVWFHTHRFLAPNMIGSRLERRVKGK